MQVDAIPVDSRPMRKISVLVGSCSYIYLIRFDSLITTRIRRGELGHSVVLPQL